MMFLRPILLFTVFFCSFCCRAQDKEYGLNDSAVLLQDSIQPDLRSGLNEEPELNGGEDNEYVEKYQPDTVLSHNELDIEPDSVKALKNSKQLAYAKNLDSVLREYQQKLKSEESKGRNDLNWFARLILSPITQYVFWALAAFFLAFILYKLFFTEGFFQSAYARVQAVTAEDEKNKPSPIADYGKLIEVALREHNYRLAVRYHYLQTLQKLSSKGAIEFSTDKTNHQYVQEMAGKKYSRAFAALTLDYEYIWYGEFEIDEATFNLVQDKFKKFNTEL